MSAALVTGGGSGIGEAVAARLVHDGYRVAIVGRRPDRLDAVAARLGPAVLPCPADVGDPAAVERAVDAAVAAFGGLDAVVLNAGGGHDGTILEHTPETFESDWRTNLFGAFLVARAALPHLLPARGAIVAVSSVSGLRASPRSVGYCTSKAGMIMLAQCLAVDHGPAGLRANAVCPGWVRTPMGDAAMDGLGEDREAAYARATRYVPARRPASPDEVARTIVWLLGPAASYVNGAAIPVDGGTLVPDVATILFTPDAPGDAA